MPHLYRRALSALASFALCAGLLFNAFPAVQAASIIYVAPEGLADEVCGTGWDNPCELQYVLTTLAQPGDELWVKAGTYKPTGDGNVNASFNLREGVRIYGGFAGNETSADQRNPAAHASILSGDLGVEGFAGDNAKHVVRAMFVSSATLDGFTITGGNAAIDPFSSAGGGLHLYESNLILNNLSITANLGERGGGLFIDGGMPELNHVTISENTALLLGGGAYILRSGAQLVDVTIASNQAQVHGGGLYASDFTGLFDSVRIENNAAINGDGGGANFLNTRVQMWRTIMMNNFAGDAGGGLYNIYDPLDPWNSTPQTVQDTQFINNRAQFGAGLYSAGEIIINESAFISNTAQLTGGAILLDQLLSLAATHHTVSNTTFYGNSAQEAGGAIDASETTAWLTNVTIFNNTTVSGVGGGIANHHHGDLGEPNLLVANAIIWNNGGSQVTNTGTASISILNSVVKSDGGGNCAWPSTTCTQVSNIDPLLFYLGNNGGFTPTMALLPGSPAIDSGNMDYCDALDQRGVTRPQGSDCDMGAYESRGFNFTYLSGDNQVTLPGTPFAQPLRVSVSSPYGEPVEGGSVIFKGPLTGAGVVLGPSNELPAPITGGTASRTVMANGETGAYTVYATMTGGQNTQGFQLENRKYTPSFGSSSSPNPSVYGEPVLLSANILPDFKETTIFPTGTVQFKIDGENYGDSLTVNGFSTAILLNTLSVGSHVISVEYSGDAIFKSAAANHVHVVNLLEATGTLTSSKTPAVYGDILKVTLKLQSPLLNLSAPTGTVQFKVDGENRGEAVTLASGSASIQVSGLTTGPHTISAEYSGESRFKSGTYTFVQQVNPLNEKYTAAGALTSSLNPALYSLPVTFTASIAAPISGILAPTGTVQFKVDGEDYVSPVALNEGSASLTVFDFLPGSHEISAEYSGDDLYKPQSVTLSQTVDRFLTPTILTSAENPVEFSRPVTVTASVLVPPGSLPMPTGTMQFVVDNELYGDPVPLNAVGDAILEISGLTIGMHTVRADFSGDSIYLPVSSLMVPQTVVPLANKYTAVSALSSSNNPAFTGDAITFRISLSAPPQSGLARPAGSVQFTLDGKPYGPSLPLINGAASLDLSDLAAGNHVISVAYSGDDLYRATVSALQQEIIQNNWKLYLPLANGPSR